MVYVVKEVTDTVWFTTDR